MSPRGPRLAAALSLLAAGLFAGRWLAGFLADRWWAATVSSETGLVLTSRALVSVGLDAIGVTLALLWFGLNGRAVLGTVAELGPKERGGNVLIREALQERAAWFWVAVGVSLLSVLAGTGLSEWVDVIALAGSGLRFGVADPALGIDAGWFVARLPLWLRLQAFATVLVLTAVSLVGAAYLLSGAVRIGRGRLAITDRARRHLGLLLAVLALVIGASRVLAPYELAAGIPAVVVPGVVQLYRSTGFVMAGLSMAAAGVSALWAFRGAHALAAGAWLAFTAALVGAEALLPSDRPDPRDPAAGQMLAEFEAVSYALRLDRDSTLPAPRPSLWDRGAVARVAGGDGGDPAGVDRTAYPGSDGPRPAWFAIGDRLSPGGTDLFIFPDDTAGRGGRPLSWRPGHQLPDSATVAAARLPRLSVRPGARAIERGPIGGIPLQGFARRLALAWALQEGGLLTADEGAVAWHLTPAARLRHLAPWAVWSGTRAWIIDGRVRWLVDGYSVSDAFPVSRRRVWLGRTVSLARPGFIGLIDAVSGATEVFLRPGADSLSTAWARVSRGLVRPASGLPDSVAGGIGYPEDLLLLQADLFPGRDALETGPERTTSPGLRGHPLPGPSAHSFIVPLIHHASERVTGLLIGLRTAEGDRLVYHGADSARGLASPDALRRQWQRLSLVATLRDSILTAGGDTLTGEVRYAPGGDGLRAWQPLVSGSRTGVRLVAVAVARGDRLGAGRTWEEAWSSLEGEGASRSVLGGPLGALEEARRWAGEADSALRRGDLVGFAKAFAALREALHGVPTEPPK